MILKVKFSVSGQLPWLAQKLCWSVPGISRARWTNSTLWTSASSSDIICKVSSMIPSLPRGWDVYIWTHCHSDPFTFSETNFNSFSKGTLPRLCRSRETGVEGGSSGYITSSNSSNRWRMEMYNTLNAWRETIQSNYPLELHSQSKPNKHGVCWMSWTCFCKPWNLEFKNAKPNNITPNSRNSPAMPGGKEDSVVRFV